MTTDTLPPQTTGAEAAAAATEAEAAQAVWLPLVVIILAQIQLSFNVNALPVSIGPIVDDLNTPATGVATALVVYSLVVAAFVMVGAKLGAMLGERLVC